MVDGLPVVSESRVANAKGEYRWMLHRTEPLRENSGKIVRWFGSSIDIEDLKRVQHELHALKEQLQKENIALRDEIIQTSMFEEIVGTSEPLRRVLGMVAKVAGTDSTVLITGETHGNSSRAIHKRSLPRRGRSCPVNSGPSRPHARRLRALRARKGAFTGSARRRLGRLSWRRRNDLPRRGRRDPCRDRWRCCVPGSDFERVGGANPSRRRAHYRRDNRVRQAI
jgi:formate hydrogenlyase transcriptional activator